MSRRLLGFPWFHGHSPNVARVLFEVVRLVRAHLSERRAIVGIADLHHSVGVVVAVGGYLPLIVGLRLNVAHRYKRGSRGGVKG